MRRTPEEAAWAALIVIVVLFALFWLAARAAAAAPDARSRRALIDSLEPGDEIVSAGGFYGVIKEIEGETLHVEIADGLVVRMARSAVVGHRRARTRSREERDEDDASCAESRTDST